MPARGVRGFVPRPSAFTITELLVAIVVLIAVFVAAEQIFSTTSRVSGGAAAVDDVLQSTAAIERRLRDDLARLSGEGVFAIRCVAVPNDVNGAVLLDPTRPRDAVIRADQLLFFTTGESAVQTHALGAGAERKGRSSAARVYYGPGFDLGPGAPAVTYRPDPRSFDPVDRVMPWARGPIAMRPTRLEAVGDHDVFAPLGGVFTFERPAPDARRRALVRQAVALADDDLTDPAGNAKTVYLGGPGAGGVVSARSLFLRDPRPDVGFAPTLMHGRTDAAALTLNEVRGLLAARPDGTPRPWRAGAADASDDQYGLISDHLLYYPRAERDAPGMHRSDQALTNHVIAPGCSSVRIEWTYADGVGAAPPWAGVGIDAARPHPWFGLPDSVRGVGMYGDAAFQRDAGFTPAETIVPVALDGGTNPIERIGAHPLLPGATAYEAIFGLNRDTPLVTAPEHPDYGRPARALAYTPWPTSLRITLVLHDPRAVLTTGRTVQFIVHLGGAP